MNILIVDDNANNRMILRLLLEDFEEDSPIAAFYIEEASDGVEAVNKCSSKSFDLIFMDIMMPNMDGIEATKVIRETNSKVMIIGLSAVNDVDRQKKILNSGAEDYISKPVNSDIFISRISNYITILAARNDKVSYSFMSRANLFSSKIYSRKTVFSLNTEDALSEFWEFFLLNATLKYDYLNDVVRTIFSIAESLLRLSTNCEVYVEESDEVQYFTITKVDKLPQEQVNNILNKNPLKCEYKTQEGKISFKLQKIYSYCDVEDMGLENIESQEEIIASDIESTLQDSSMGSENIESQEEIIASDIESKLQDSSYESKELRVFDYLDEDDLIDLEEYSSKLSSLMLVVGSEDVSLEEVNEIYSYLERLGSVLSSYSDLYDISKALSLLSADMANHIEEFMKNSAVLGPMCKAFSRDFSTWIEKSFHTGAPSIDFMNDTIVVNCQTISSMLKMDEQVDESAVEDLDDIFDF